MGDVPAGLDLSKLAPSASRAPDRLGGCDFDVAGRVWVPKGAVGQVPKERQKTLLKGFQYQVEKARTGQSTCKRCGEKIEKSALRVGYPIKDQRGEFGALVVWLHVPCARGDFGIRKLAEKGALKLKEKVLGIDALMKSERERLTAQLLEEDELSAAPAEPPALPAPRQLAMHQAPEALTVPLLPFQAEGLGWLLAREADPATRGGILADEMGMGKTLQTISLLLAGEAKGPTLVVCPAAAMLQWRNEIARFTKEGALEVELYYGSERRGADLGGSSSKVVLTTYQTLEADYRREVNRCKVECQWCKRMFLPEKLGYHQKYFCGPDARRTEKQSMTDLKTEAVKRMKIGGLETEIVLNPRTAIRTAAIAAARSAGAAAKGGAAAGAEGAAAAGAAESPTGGPAEARTLLPFPAAVLPTEAREALGVARGGAAGAAGAAGAPEASSPGGRGRGRGRGGGRGRKRARADGGEETPPASAAAGLAAGGDGGQEAETPEALQAPAARRRWGAGLLRPGAADKPAEPLAEAALGAPKTAWGSRLRRPTRVIALDAGLESDSDADGVVLLGLQGHLAAGFGSASSSSSSAAAPRAGPGAARTAPGPRGSELPPRPDSSDDEEMGDQRGIDLSSSPLMSTRWGRVVLDEAHRIKGRINSTAQAAFALKASTRWCLSGTPLQNRVGELYSLARFVRFYPYAHYFCVKKGCDCASLHYRFDPTTSTCCKCGHAKAQHRSHFASEISTPIKRFGFMGAGRTAMEKLRADVLDKILLRRTKEERQADIRLPPLKISIRKDSLSAEERDFYTSMYMQSQTKFDTYVEKDTLLHNYAHVFDLIMRLRQALDHPYLIVHGSLRQENGLIPSKSRGDAHVCALCQEDVSERSELVVASCGHAFHRECVSEYLEQAPTLPTGGIGCPTCFAPLTLSLEEADDDDAAGAEMHEPPEATLAKKPPSRSILQRIKTAEFKTSTKIEALLQEVQQMMQNNGSSKALVFSQFVNFLELIEWRLKREGIQCAKLLGSMPITNRNNIILSFMSDPHLKVLLISLKAGGEGLNLQAADHIFLMDPWWNPASELQAIQRAHRIGQTRPVKAVRFVMTDTIEEKIIELQNKKQSVFDCTVGGSNTALQRLTSEDIKFLFNQ